MTTLQPAVPESPEPTSLTRYSRRLLLRSGATLVAAVGLAACGALPNPLGGHVSIASKPVTLNLYYGPFFVNGGGQSPENKLMGGIAAAYQKAQPNVTVNAVEITPGIFQDFSAIGDPGSSAHADVLVGQNLGTFRNFNTQDAVLPLDSYIRRETDVTPSSFYPAALHLWNRVGHQLGLPRDIQPVDIIYYNRTLIKGAGLGDPADGWTTDDFLVYVQQLQQGLSSYPASKPQHWAFVDAQQATSFRDFIEIFGGRQSNYPQQPERAMYDTSQAIAGARYYADLYRNFHVAPTSLERAGAYNTSVLPDFLTGNVPLMLAGSNLIATLQSSLRQINWDITLLPIKTDVKQSWNAQGTGVFLMKASSIPDVSWDLIKFLVAGDGMKMRAAQGDVHPAAIKIADSSAYPPDKPPLGKRLFSTIGMAQMIDVDPSTLPPAQATPGPSINYTAMNRNISLSLDDMLSGKIPVEQTMMQINQQANSSSN